MGYDKKAFRSIKHGVEDVDSHCRNCNFSECGKGEVATRARYHAKTTLHTVDVYRSHWTEYTSYIKDLPHTK